jgi:DNA-binding PadR family transcriptional regulator
MREEKIDGRGRPREIDYTAILYDLYRLRTLSVEQIRNVHFKGKESSVYVTLHRMKKNGLLESTCRVRSDGKKIAACYYIREKGIHHLYMQGKIKKPRRAYDNKPDGKKLSYLIETNDLYVQLHEYDYEMIDAREWKSRFEMDRNAMVKAGLKTADGKEYGVYIFEQDVNEDKTLVRFKNEIKNNPQTSRFIIFFKGIDSFNKLYKQMNEVELSHAETNLLPYTFGVNALKEFNTENQFVNLFAKYGVVKINDRSNTITSLFADYILTVNGEEYYICNYLFRNEVARHYLRSYSIDRYQRDGRKVLIFTWQATEENLNSIEDDFKQYPHIQVIKFKGERCV